MFKSARNFDDFNRRSDLPEFALFVGTIVGVGIFALPAAFSNTPRISFLILTFSAVVLYSLYHFYIELVLKKRMGFNQLPGILNKVFGRKAQHLSTVVLMIGRSGILFLYILIIGKFTGLLLQNAFGIEIQTRWIALSVAIICSIAVRRHIKVVATTQLTLTAIMIFIIGCVSVMGTLLKFNKWTPFFAVDLGSEISMVMQNPIGFIKGLGLIYGVSIGALSGIAVVPSLKSLNHDPKALRHVALISSITAVILYFLFVTFVLSHSTEVSPDALSGLGNYWWVDMLAFAG